MLKFKILSVCVISISFLLSGCNKKDDVTMWKELASNFHDHATKSKELMDGFNFEIEKRKTKYQGYFIYCISGIYNRKLTSEERNGIDAKNSNISEGLDKSKSQYSESLRESFNDFDDYKYFDTATEACLIMSLIKIDKLRNKYIGEIWMKMKEL